MKPEIIVVTAAYGHQQVAALGGQLALLPIIQQAGADGVEIRRELCDDTTLTHLPALALAARQHQLRVSYSVPDTLFSEDGRLNPLLKSYFSEALQLNAQRLKVALGNFTGALYSEMLRKLMTEYGIPLTVENDQTRFGKQQPMLRFFNAAQEAALPIGMTFDMGNWYWTDEDPRQAADLLAGHVGYVHVKAAAPQGTSYRAIALDDAPPGWQSLLHRLPATAPRGIEFPLEGNDLIAVTRHYVTLLRNV